MPRILLLLVIVLASPALEAKPLPLVPYRGSNFVIDVPKGWTVTADEAAGWLGAAENRNDKRAAGLMILTNVAVDGVDAASVTRNIAKRLAGDRIRIVHEEPIENGRSVIAEGVIDGHSVRVGMIVLVANGAAVVAALFAAKHRFERLGGLDTVRAVLHSFRFVTAGSEVAQTRRAIEAAQSRIASPIAEGVYVGVTERTAAGRHGATMELVLVWYTFGAGWFQHWFGPPEGLDIERSDDALAYEIVGDKLRYVSRGTTYERTFKRLANDRIRLDAIELTKVDRGYDGLVLAGTYHAESVGRALARGATTTAGATTAVHAQTLVMRKDGTAEHHRSTGVDTPHGTSNADVRRTGRYAIARNRITFSWRDGTSNTYTFSTWGSTKHLLIEKTLYTLR